jgi:H+/Cl- antiporter ClcA
VAAEAPARGSDHLRLVGLGALIGVPAALVAALFLALVHEVEGWLWDDLPDALGREGPPWFLIVGLPVAGAVIVLAVRRLLPGDGGHPPLEGLHTEPTPPTHMPGVALAALGTLPFGAVLGPEAPVVSLGSAIGVVVSRLVRARPDDRSTAVLAGAGSFAAIAAIFGGPLVGGIFLLEAGLGLGAALVPTLLPGFVAAAVGYVLFVGFGDWGGLDAPGLVVPDLPVYDGTRIADLVLAVVVGAATAVAVAVVHRLGKRVAGLGPVWA